VNEVTLLYYGQAESLGYPLLSELNILEVRPANDDNQGFYILENKFGKEVLRKVSIGCSEEKCDWLLYRYLSDEETEKLKNDQQGRRIYFLVQNFIPLEYFSGLTLSAASTGYFLAGGAQSMLKSYSYVSPRVKTKNVLLVKSQKQKKKEAVEKSSGIFLPHFLVLFLKLLLNPIDELGRQSNLLMHSNRRILSRSLELVQFLHFAVKMTAVILYNVLGIKLFWRAMKIKWLLRHLFLMTFYRLWGVAVDLWNLLIRLKDKVVGTVYYKFVHQILHYLWLKVFSPLVFGALSVLGVVWAKILSPLYYSTIHRALHFSWVILAAVTGKLWQYVLSPLYFNTFHRLYHAGAFVAGKIWQYVLSPLYYGTVHKLYHHSLVIILYRVWPWIKYHIFIKLHHLLVYKIKHFFLMALYKFYGLLFDAGTFSYRVTKLYLMYPVFKIFWFTRFQYNKRIKKFFV
jgi:hypothetical protein